MPRVTPADKGQLVFEAAHHLIRQGGIEAVTMRAVAAEAGISPSGVRHLFGRQEHLLRCAWWLVHQELEREVRLTAYRVIARLEREHPAPGEGDAGGRVEILLDLLTSMLPVSDGRVEQARLLMAYEARALHDEELAAEVDRWLQDRREWCGVVVRRLGVPDAPAATIVLDALVCGLTRAVVRGRVAPGQARGVLERQLRLMLDEREGGGLDEAG